VSGRDPTGRLPPGTKVLERLVQEAILDPSQYQRVLLHAQRGGDNCEDAVIDLGYLGEAELLKYLAGMYRTRFVSTAKLSKASIDASTLRLVPRKVAERLGICPILFDGRTQALSVVAVDLEEHDIAKQVQLVSNVREVNVYVARPATVRALIRKHYDGDKTAFAELSARDRAPATDIGFDKATGNFASTDYYDEPGLGSGLFDLGGVEQALDKKQTSPGIAPRRPVSLTFEMPKVEDDMTLQVPEANDAVAPDDYLETLNVLVALRERSRAELRGHSSQVVRLARRLCERVGLSTKQMHGVLVAGYLHDIGKASTFHLTAFNVSQYEGHRLQAQKTCMTPVRMFESARLTETAVQTLAHMYETYDGKGFPDKLAGKTIPLGARILAIVETYLDLTSHAKNPYRKVLDPKEGCQVLDRLKGVVFDPNLVELFRSVVLGDDLKAKLLADRPTVLVVDADPEETTVLELRLVEHGFDVEVTRTAASAADRLKSGDVDLVITELDLTPDDGFSLLEDMKKSGIAAEVPLVFLTRRSDRDSVTRGFELGAADFLVKPASADVVCAKAKQIIESRHRRPGRGVRGSLSEMSLPDVLQILSNGRKTGHLKIRAGRSAGDIVFVEGAMWDANFGEAVGAEAVYAMLLLAEGDFVLDPDAAPGERRIDQSTETLLLEGLRRLDEGRR